MLPLARRTTLTLLLAIGLLGLALPADALAMSKSKATKIALAALRPQKQKRFPTVVFALPRLRAKDRVTFAGRPETRDEKKGAKVTAKGDTTVITRKAKKLGKPTWLFWMDEAYDAGFGHESRMVLVDDRSGRVVAKRTLHYWPVVNGKDPAFITKRGTGDRKYRVFQSFKGAAPAAAAANRPPAAWVSANELKPNGLRGECVIVLGDPALHAATDRITEFFSSRGATVFGPQNVQSRFGSGSAPDGGDLQTFIPKITKMCPDIIIYLTGHGSDADTVTVGTHRSVQADGSVAEEDSDVKPGNISLIIRQNPNTKFKVIVDACNAGAFARVSGLKVAVTATGSGSWPTEKTSVALTVASGDFTLEFIRQMEIHEAEVQGDTSGEDHGARLIERAGRTTDNFGRYHRLGLAHVQVRSTLVPYTAETLPPPPPTQGGYQVAMSGTYYHDNPGVSSSLYGCVSTSPGQAGAQYAFMVTGPNDYSQSGSGTLDAQGHGQFQSTITQFGTYHEHVDVTSNGVVASADTDVDVKSANGQQGCG